MKNETINKLMETAEKHAPGILTGIGIAGMLTAMFWTATATVKVLKKMKEAEEQKGEPLTRSEKFKTAAPDYIPAAVSAAVSIACIICAGAENKRRNTALSTAFAISESAFREYRDKVTDIAGEKTEKEVRDAISQDKVSANPPKQRNGSEIVIVEHGGTMCYDSLSGRYFKSDADKIKKAVNEINRRLLEDSFVPLNDFYFELGMDEIGIGSQLGWKIDKGLMRISFSSTLSANSEPCMVIDYNIEPYFD